MGAGTSRRSEAEVHVVVVQSSQESGVDAKVIRKGYRESDAAGEALSQRHLSSNNSYYDVRSLPRHSVPSQSTSDTLARAVERQTLQPKSRVFEPLKLSSKSSQDFTSSKTQLTNKQRLTSDEPPHSGEAGRTTFEIFRTYDGEEFTVYTRDDGKLFYVDFEEQKWRYFPTSWEKRGYFQAIDYDPYEAGKEEQFGDSRSGEFIHPTRGKLQTYLRQEMQNILYFLDDNSGSWLPIPLNWERHIPHITKMVEKVQRACPEWKDTRAIVALLRQCNYNVEDCISTYSSLNDDGVLDTAENSHIRVKFDKQLADNRIQMKQMTERIRELKAENEVLQTRVQEVDLENKRLREASHSDKLQSHGFRLQRRSNKPTQQLLSTLKENTHMLHIKLSCLQSSVAKLMGNYRTGFGKFATALSQFVRLYRGQAREISEVRALYQKESLHRKLLYNEVQELRGNIRVFCRCRYDNREPCALNFETSGIIVCPTGQGRRKAYEFEKILLPNSTQEEVFEDTKAIITSCADGYNVCIIAYGQTGAGKTYTMTGTRDRPGVNIRAMKELFKVFHERTKVKYSMKVSIVEVYNEAVFDLLVAPDDGHEKLQIVRRGKDTVVQGLTEIEVRSMDDIIMIMREGEQNRTVADTKMNKNSSRSHQVLMLAVEGYDRVSKTTTKGRLTLVDLAGSERISRSEATGIRLVEAASINKSLSALGQVFSSIRNNTLHVPYRNSKLTFLLQPSIGGDSKVCVFVNISPLASNVAETISTLEFGQNVRQVELGQAHKHITRSS